MGQGQVEHKEGRRNVPAPGKSRASRRLWASCHCRSVSSRTEVQTLLGVLTPQGSVPRAQYS